MSRWENAPTTRELVRLTGTLVDIYCASYPAPPAVVTLDIDDTVDVVHGAQQLSFWNGHYGERCFLPIHVYDTATARPVAMLLRTGKTPSGAEVASHVRRLVRRIRRHWPTTRITLRGDGHYGRPEPMAWCEANDVDYVFGLPGKVQGLMKFSRANFMVPVPVAASFDELNAHLAERCLARQAERAGRHADTIGERLVADTQALRPLPAVPLEPCEKRSARVSSTALVRYRTNDYSVPTAYAFQEVLVKGFVEEVVVLCAGEEVARHPRCYGEGVFVSNPLHYLALIETNPGALDQAAALQGWDLPEVFQHLRHLLEARMGIADSKAFT